MLELGWVIERSDDEEVSGMKSGMQVVRYNYLKLIPRLLGEMAKSEQYSAEGTDMLGKSISASVIKNSGWMTQSDKESLLSELKKAMKSIDSQEVTDNLKSCIQVLDK